MTDLVVFLVVLLLRLGVPLLILRFPLPAIMFALVLDAADQTIFQALTDIDLTNYQSYDKALDIFYLAIAYIATFRNWRNGTAILVAAGLWYYRLVGVTLFELTEWRPLLLIFPNTFEYYFIAIAIIRLRWDDLRLSRNHVLAIAAGIWVFIKLPQEYWIHIAQLDVTDFVKNDLLGVETTDSFGAGFSNRPLVGIAMLAVLIAIVGVCAVLWRRAPQADHAFTMDADKIFKFDERKGQGAPRTASWTEGLLEKIVLVSLIAIIFGRAVPGTQASVPEVIFGVAILVAANAAVTQILREHGRSWAGVARAFFGNLVVNAVLLVGLIFVMPANDNQDSGLASGFFLFMLSLVIALFDRYRPTRRPMGWNEQLPHAATAVVSI